MDGTKVAIDAVTIGPFKGGLNNVSQSGESADTEVVDLVNMGLTMDGALTSRMPITVVSGISTARGSFEVLGVYRETPTLWYLIIQLLNDKGGWNVRALPMGINMNVVDIRITETVSNKVTAFVQVNDWGYFSAAPGESVGLVGFKWQPGGAYKELPTMPRGNCMVSFKNRLWITGTELAATNSRIWFTTIDSGGIKIDTWNTAVDYFDMAPGEGGYNTAMIALNSSLVIFKNDGTWRFSFSSTPAKGVVDKISGTIGAANRNVVVEFNNLVYSYDQGKVYELVNNTFSAINKKVEFREDSKAVDRAVGTDLSVAGTNIILRYMNALYVFNGETGTWCQWRTRRGIPGKFIELPADSNSSKASTFIAPSMGILMQDGSPINTYRLLRLEGDYLATTVVETIECTVRTKSYDYKAPSVYKRLFWWGIDHKSHMTFTATAIPIVKKRVPSWGELKQKVLATPVGEDITTQAVIGGYTWGQLREGTWGNPLKFQGLQTSVSDSFDVTNEQTDNGRIFSKIKKSLRFRQIAYEVTMFTGGTVTTGPVKIFSFVTYVSAKHNVVDKNN